MHWHMDVLYIYKTQTDKLLFDFIPTTSFPGTFFILQKLLLCNEQRLNFLFFFLSFYRTRCTGTQTLCIFAFASSLNHDV